MAKKNSKLRIIPLGGLGEIGKNITVFEYGEDIIVVDCGIAFPDEDMMGIDMVIPDTTYLKNNASKIKGFVITHGHEDHIGALPYVLRDIKAPVFGSRLALGLIGNKLEEHHIRAEHTLQTVEQGQVIELGEFKVEFIQSCHSIAGAFAIAIHTPVGIVVHTSDFKVDYTPIEGKPMDLVRLAELGSEGVLLLMSDSTNVEREGYTLSERTVGETLQKLFRKAEGRILVATFASNIHRIQQIINAAVSFNRKVAVCGRSMINVVKVAMDLGYLTAPEGTVVEIEKINNYPSAKLVIISTGSQGEPMSALSRMAAGEHRQVEIVAGDMVVISSTPIPGNEKTVSRVINALYKKGANVIYEALEDTHVSGHACQEELKLIQSIVKPKYFMPVHGEYRHLRQHAILAQSMGMPKENTFILDIGNVLEIDMNAARMNGKVISGKVFVDGLGVGDVGNIVLRDRKVLSQDGLVIVIITIEKESGNMIANPDVISRGFVYVREAEKLMDEMRDIAKQALVKYAGKEWSTIKTTVKDSLREFLYVKTKRKPMILPIIVEI